MGVVESLRVRLERPSEVLPEGEVAVRCIEVCQH